MIRTQDKDRMQVISITGIVQLAMVCISIWCVHASAVNGTKTPPCADRRKFRDCKYSNGKVVGGSKPEVYWINLNSSILRRKAMTTFLNDYGLPHFRVEALARKDLYVPDDLVAGWAFRCNPKTSFTPRAELNQYENSLDRMYPRKIFVKGLCGSAENNKKELVVLISHLLAIRNAVYSTTATSRYALILEDDVWTPFDINFEQMALELKTELGRPFGIVQLFNSKARTLDEYFHCFTRPNNYNCQLEFGQHARWATRQAAQQGRFLQTWSTGAYLINRAVMKPIIDKVFANEFLGWTSVTIIAAKNPPCVPSICCDSASTKTINNKTVETISPTAPVHCVYAPVGTLKKHISINKNPFNPLSFNSPSITHKNHHLLLIRF